MPNFVPTRSSLDFDLSTTLFIASLLCMSLAEAFMIRGLVVPFHANLPSIARI